MNGEPLGGWLVEALPVIMKEECDAGQTIREVWSDFLRLFENSPETRRNFLDRGEDLRRLFVTYRRAPIHAGTTGSTNPSSLVSELLWGFTRLLFFPDLASMEYRAPSWCGHARRIA
jgi:hypothetical protein